MAARKQPEGRFIVGNKACPCIGSALAYASTLAYSNKATMYVRVIGEQKPVGYATWTEDGVSVVQHKQSQ